MASKSASDHSTKGTESIFGIFIYFSLSTDKFSRSGSKSDQDSSHQSVRDNSQITCFFKACDRDASEKLLNHTYACKITWNRFLSIRLFIYYHSDKQKNGIYMLRQSARDENKFVLSLIKDGQCYHYRTHHMGNGTFLDEKTDSIFYCKISSKRPFFFRKTIFRLI